MPGPPKKDPELTRRRRATAGFRQLPYEGRKGPPPAFPLDEPLIGAIEEATVWSELWATPQASEWERLGWVRVVARYVRILVESEQSNANPQLRAEARQLEDRLGLTPMAMMKLRWETDEPIEEEEEPAPRAKGPARVHVPRVQS